MPFLWKEKSETVLIASLNSFAKGKEQIPIELSGFGAFHPRVIFVSVRPNEPLNQLQYQLQKFCKTEFNLFNAQYEDRPCHPHITLAFRDLKKEMFVAAWSEFRERQFVSSFIIDGMTLLKHDGKLWQPVSHFIFKSP
jgi:2'-5' RNA ligase